MSVKENVSPPAKLFTPMGVAKEDCIVYGDSVWATRPEILEFRVFIKFRLLSHVDTVNVSMGSVVGGANNP